MTPNTSTTTIVHCSAERVVGQDPCVSGLCARRPLSTDITCILDSYPCPIREYSGACSCGPTSVREACPVPTGFCDTRWDGFFCSNGSIVECYGGKTLNLTACSESETCSPSGLNSAICIPRPPQAPPIGVFIDEPFAPFAADFPGDDGLLVPTYDRCTSRWSPNVCLSDVLLKICSTDRTFDCMFGCMQTETGAECRCNCGDDAYDIAIFLFRASSCDSPPPSLSLSLSPIDRIGASNLPANVFAVLVGQNVQMGCPGPTVLVVIDAVTSSIKAKLVIRGHRNSSDAIYTTF
jgi:hypothetical protein